MISDSSSNVQYAYDIFFCLNLSQIKSQDSICKDKICQFGWLSSPSARSIIL